MNPDELRKLEKVGENHPDFPGRKICPTCGDALLSHGRDENGDPIYDGNCSFCRIKLILSSRELTPEELAEWSWKEMVSCESCRKFPHLLRSQYCLDCYIYFSKLLEQEPSPEILQENRGYVAVDKERWIAAEVEQILKDRR